MFIAVLTTVKKVLTHTELKPITVHMSYKAL